MSLRRTLSASLVGLAVAALPAGVAAQICTGVPSSGRDLTVAAVTNMTEGVDSYGAMLHFNSPGYTSFTGGWMLDDYQAQDESGHTFFGRLGVELDQAGAWPVQVCPVGTAQYTRLQTDLDIGDGEFLDRRYALIAGVGVGREFPVADRVSVGAYAIPSVAYVNARQETRLLGDVVVDEGESTDFVVRAGGTLRFDRIHLGAEYSTLDLGNEDGILAITLGYNVGIP